MATGEEKVGDAAADDGFTYAEDVLADGETTGPESGDPSQSQPDPDSTTSKKVEEQAAEEEKKGNGKGGADNLKTTLIISGAVVAVVGAIFAIAKKIREA